MEVETNSQPREPSSSNENMVAAPTEDSRTHSNPTLEEVIAKQHASRHNPPLILPRPSNKDYSSPDAHSHSRPAARKSSRSVVESKPKEHQNKCPPPGTRAAKLRTIEASLARCTSPDKAQALLAKKGFTLQGWAEHKAMIAATKPKSKGRGKSMGTGKLRYRTRRSTTSAQSHRTQYQQPVLQTEPLPPLRESFSVNCGVPVDNNGLKTSIYGRSWCYEQNR